MGDEHGRQYKRKAMSYSLTDLFIDTAFGDEDEDAMAAMYGSRVQCGSDIARNHCL